MIFCAQAQKKSADLGEATRAVFCMVIDCDVRETSEEARNVVFESRPDFK